MSLRFASAFLNFGGALHHRFWLGRRFLEDFVHVTLHIMKRSKVIYMRTQLS